MWEKQPLMLGAQPMEASVRSKAISSPGLWPQHVLFHVLAQMSPGNLQAARESSGRRQQAVSIMTSGRVPWGPLGHKCLQVCNQTALCCRRKSPAHQPYTSNFARGRLGGGKSRGLEWVNRVTAWGRHRVPE